MSFYVILENNYTKNVDNLEVGDLVLCEDGYYYPVKSVLVTSGYPLFCRLSNGLTYYIPERMFIKTIKGFKKPELWDIIPIDKTLTPQIVSVTNIEKIMFFRDILIDGNMITPEGVIFKYSS
jgi:hypothetical protein